jgi:uncharacterized membrane protein (UPF0127 family)
MRVLHERDATERVLATDVDVAASTVSRARGLMFRRSIPDDYALMFEFDGPEAREVHMLFVPFPIDAIWLVDDAVTHVKRLRSWVGLGRARADTLLELPAGAADGVAVGDVVHVEDA